MTFGQRIFLRFLFSIALFFIMTGASFPVFLIFLCMGFIFFNFYVEGMVFALFYDLFFSITVPTILNLNIATLLISFIIFLAIYFIKKFTRLSSYEI